MPEDDDLTCAAAEGALMFHPVNHDCSFKSSDCTSNLILDSKFSHAHTKSEAVAVHVLVQLAEEERHKQLNDAGFISVSSGVSNGKSF